jgi:hypothetical protein
MEQLRERLATVLFFFVNYYFIKNFSLIFEKIIHRKKYSLFITKKLMAKKTSKVSSSASHKISFGKKRKGVAKKGYSKYEQKPKKYVGQGR